MAIEGRWFPAGRSDGLAGKLEVHGGVVHITLGEGSNSVVPACSVNDLSISSRIGHIPRKITLPDNSVFEVPDNEALDVLLGLNHQKPSILHKLESRWKWVLSAVAVLLCAGVGFFYWGLPGISRTIAHNVPFSVVQSVSQNTLDVLDRIILKPSELDAVTQNVMVDKFERLASHPKVRGELSGELSLSFRKLGMMNAFALPGGQIIVTDQFVLGIDDDNQVAAVLLHEIGHVVGRHGMQQLVQSSVVAFALALLLGDPSGLEELFVALPALLLQQKYSRQHEYAADEFAISRMLLLGMDPAGLGNALARLDPAAETDSSQAGDDDSGMLDYFSSHPVTAERIRRAREASAASR